MVLAAVAARRAEGLTGQAKVLASAIRAQHQQTSVFGTTRADLALARLRTSTWNQYATAMNPFQDFLQDVGRKLNDVNEPDLEDWICWMMESENYNVKGETLGQYVSGVRTCPREFGIKLGGPAGTKGALDGYKQLSIETQPPVHVKPVFSTQHAVTGVRAVSRIRGDFRKNTLEKKEAELVIAVPHVVIAHLTFSRGDSTQPLRGAELTATAAGFTVRLPKQKRPKRNRPPEHTFQATGQPDCPIAFVRGLLQDLRCRGNSDDSLLFGTPPTATRAMALDTAVKTLVRQLRIELPGQHVPTGHCARVGSVSEAYAIGVPMPTCAHMCTHSDPSTTMGYLRFGIPVSQSAQLFFGHLHPTATDRGLTLCSFRLGHSSPPRQPVDGASLRSTN